MIATRTRNRGSNMAVIAALSTALGLTLGFIGGKGVAEIAPPTEHIGLTVDAVGLVSETSMSAQIGLSGYVLQLREITIEPGGQIAQHDHATRPGLVKVLSGAWTEGRPDGEIVYAADDPNGIVEDESTVHWIWNKGDEPATALVCDIVPAS